jgi:hypothetical protein
MCSIIVDLITILASVQLPANTLKRTFFLLLAGREGDESGISRFLLGSRRVLWGRLFERGMSLTAVRLGRMIHMSKFVSGGQKGGRMTARSCKRRRKGEDEGVLSATI